MLRQPIKYSTRYITFIAVVTAICVIGRYLFQFLPNVQPVTDIIIFITIYFGFTTGFYVATLSILISNLLLGFGIWTLPQILAYSAVVCLSYGLAHYAWFQQHLLGQAAFSLFAGYFYGFVVSAGQIPFIGGPRAFIPYYLAGLYFDSLHAIGNFVIYLALIPALHRIIKQFNLDFS
ncbi:hypothetical protein BSQ39_00480 [Loigolactobacillus backii]|nr:hypothetical protein BSQ39_00480 [Loigolactobacillus backii]